MTTAVSQKVFSNIPAPFSRMDNLSLHGRLRGFSQQPRDKGEQLPSSSYQPEHGATLENMGSIVVQYLIPVVPHKAVAEVSAYETYRRGWWL